MSVQLRIPVTEQSQPAAARRAAEILAQEGRLDETAIGRVALIVMELATNLVKHAACGELLVRRLGADSADGDGVEILSLDKGPGIPDLAQALGDGYSTAGSAGTGLGAVVRAAGEFDIYSRRGSGTAVVARLFARWRDSVAPRAQKVGVVRQAKEGEELCGDDWTVRWFADGWLCAVADGLGHGLVAAEAAGSIMQAVRAAQDHSTPVQLVEAAHVAATPTRGAAFGVAVREADTVRFAGIGNIAAVVVNGGQARHLVSHNGILGHEYRKLAEFTHRWSKDSILVMHSDGIATHWNLDHYPGLLSRDPSLIAGVLYRDFARGRDDATVVVVKEHSE